MIGGDPELATVHITGFRPAATSLHDRCTVSVYNNLNRSAAKSRLPNCSVDVDHGYHASNSISRQGRHPPGHNTYPVSCFD